MRRGTQEDAEEFLGFFLETMHEEVGKLIEEEEERKHKGSVGGKGKGKGKEEAGVGAGAEGDEWAEVGSKGRAVSTRTVRSRSLSFLLSLVRRTRCAGEASALSQDEY